jgi:MFS family permease
MAFPSRQSADPVADWSVVMDKAPTRVRYLVLAALCTIAAIAYLQRDCIGVLVDPIRADLGITREDMGWVIGAFYLSYGLFQLPAGSLAQTWGTRRALSLFATIWSVCTAIGAAATTWPLLLTSRLAMGAGEAGIFPCSMNTISQWFPITRRASACGLLGASMAVGGATGVFLTAWWVERLDWKAFLIVYALPGLAWAAWFSVWFRNRPQEHPAVNRKELRLIQGSEESAVDMSAPPPGSTPWRVLLTSPAMGWICGKQFFYAASTIFFSSWFPTYLQETRGVTLERAGLLTSLALSTKVVGSLIGGGVSDWIYTRTGSRTLSRRWLATGSMLGCAVLVLAAFPIADANVAVLVISLGSLCASLAGPCGYAITIDMGGGHIAAVFSTMNMAGTLGTAAFPVVVPWVVRLTGSWNAVLFLFAGSYVAAAVCWFMLDTRGTVFDRSFLKPRED